MAQEVKSAQVKALAAKSGLAMVKPVLCQEAQMTMPLRRSVVDLILSPHIASAEWQQPQAYIFDIESAPGPAKAGTRYSKPYQHASE